MSGWLALDVGGANLKGAHTSGACDTRPFAVWREPGRLAAEVDEFARGFPAFDALALTMTAELCDCFATKAEGVAAVLDAAEAAAAGRPLAVWGIDGAFHPVESIRCEPGLAASANWLALAGLAAGLSGPGPGLLIDVGSTTTDLVPLLDGRPCPVGRTDTERLRSGELVYAGVRRTPVCALATELPWRGAPTGMAAELFATTLDVFLALGPIAPDPLDLDTADGRPATPEAARDRLARMVGADRGGFTEGDAAALAREAEATLLDRLVRSAHRACEPIGRPGVAVVSGSGEFLARRVAGEVLGPGGRVVGLAGQLGSIASSAACAVALLGMIRVEGEPAWIARSRS
jgi:probable H4MPT-linked C1 transfer pathway protein